MGDMGEIYRAGKEFVKKRRQKRRLFFEPLLAEIGADCKADGVWEYNGWFCYPTKGFAMLRKNTRIRKSLRSLINGVLNEKEEKK